MNLEKAIEILTLMAHQGLGPPNPDYKDALLLGIEALKRLQKSRSVNQFMDMPLLPGETEE